MVTLTYNSVESALGDLNVTRAQRSLSSQMGDHLDLEVQAPADGSDVWPYDAKIILQIGRTPASGTGYDATGKPVPGLTSWNPGSGMIAFVGWRGKSVRRGSGQAETISYRFMGCWERWLMRTKFYKLRTYYNGTENVADPVDEYVLGVSMNGLIGAADTVSGTSVTCLMSLTQQLKEIVAWALTQSGNKTGSAQFQFVDLAVNESNGAYNFKFAQSCAVTNQTANGFTVVQNGSSSSLGASVVVAAQVSVVGGD